MILCTWSVTVKSQLRVPLITSMQSAARNLEHNMTVYLVCHLTYVVKKPLIYHLNANLIFGSVFDEAEN